MFITEKGLKLGFALSGVTLFAIGFNVSSIQSKKDYYRYLEKEMQVRNATIFNQNGDTLELYGCNLKDDYSTVEEGQDAFIPVIHYAFDLGVNKNYFIGEFVFSMYDERAVSGDERLIY